MVSLLAFIIIVLIFFAMYEAFYQKYQQDMRIKMAKEAKFKFVKSPKLTPQQERERQEKSDYYEKLYGDL